MSQFLASVAVALMIMFFAISSSIPGDKLGDFPVPTSQITAVLSSPPPPPPPPLPPSSSNKGGPHVYFRYSVHWGFTNQLGGHLIAGVLIRSFPFYGVVLPHAVTKKVSNGLWDTRYCIPLEEMFDINHLKTQWKKLGIVEVIDNPCVDEALPRMGRMNTVSLYPKYKRNVTIEPVRHNSIEMIIAEIRNATAKAESMMSEKPEEGPVCVVVDMWPFGAFYKGTTDIKKLPQLLYDRARAGVQDWILSPKLQSLHDKISISKNTIVWHLRGEADGIWMTVDHQYNEFKRFQRKLRLPLNTMDLYLATGMKEFTRRKDGSIQAVRSKLTKFAWKELPFSKQYKSVHVSTDYVPQMADLSMEVAACVQFFAVLKASYVFSVRESSWGIGVAQYRALLHNNTNTILFLLKDHPGYLMNFHNYLFRDFPDEFCKVNDMA
eukprot:PhF_6_TR37837/c1_g1_i1/m.56320